MYRPSLVLLGGSLWCCLATAGGCASEPADPGAKARPQSESAESTAAESEPEQEPQPEPELQPEPETTGIPQCDAYFEALRCMEARRPELGRARAGPGQSLELGLRQHLGEDPSPTERQAAVDTCTQAHEVLKQSVGGEDVCAPA